MRPKSFTGYRGVAGLFRVGEIQFLVLAPNAEQLKAIYDAILTESGPFNPDACQKSLVISSSILPEPKPNHEQTDKNPNS